MGATRPSVPDLDLHAKEEEVARVAGDYAAERRTAWTRFFVPAFESLLVPDRCGIIAAEMFEVDLDGELDLAPGSILEILS